MNVSRQRTDCIGCTAEGVEEEAAGPSNLAGECTTDETVARFKAWTGLRYRLKFTFVHYLSLYLKYTCSTWRVNYCISEVYIYYLFIFINIVHLNYNFLLYLESTIYLH